MLGESVRRRQSPRRAVAGPRLDRRRWLQWLVGLPLALAVPFIIGYFIATRLMFPPAALTGTGIPVPNLVGSSVSDAHYVLAEAGLGELQTMDLPHPTAPAGQIIAQTPLAGQQLRPGAGVQVARSAGRPRAIVPDVAGFSRARAVTMLERGGFEVMEQDEASYSAVGRVIRTEPVAGEELALPAMVTLFVSTGPAMVADTVPPDTIRPDTIR